MRTGSRSMGDDDHEQMQLLHRRIRQHQQRQAHLEARRKMREQEMVREYKEGLETCRSKTKEEVRDRLDRLKRMQLRAAQRSTADDVPPTDLSQEHSGADFVRLSIQPRTRAKMETYRKQRPVVLRAPSMATKVSAGNEPDDEHQLSFGWHATVDTIISTGQFPSQQRDCPEDEAASDGSMEAAGNEQSPAAAAPKDAAVLAGCTHQVHRNLARRHRLQVMHHVAAEVLQYRQQMAGVFQFTLPPI